jgi:hypothetical protein
MSGPREQFTGDRPWSPGGGLSAAPPFAAPVVRLQNVSTTGADSGESVGKGEESNGSRKLLM